MLKSLVAAGFAVSALSLGAAHAGAAAKVEDMKGAQLIEYAAQPYIQFREDIDHVSTKMPASEAEMRDAYFRLASHDNRTMAASWIAYAAMIAADSPEFASAIEAKMKKRRDAEAFAAEIEANPVIVRNMAGSEAAVAAIMAFATNDAAKIRKAGDQFIAEAYAMQNVAWAKREIALAGMDRVDAAMQFAAKRKWADYDREVVVSRKGTARPNLVNLASWSKDWGDETAVNPAARPSTIVTKALVLGARYVMNDAEQRHLASFGTSKKSERCFTNAQMNLDQCIAATRTPYEEAFCLGQHALNDMSSCVGWPAAAGASGA
ncbi:hypothetical protein HK107_11770 [Parvularcula sp. ZS-1/3]|uniref:DUF4034 domain-containing protein n=1 Tax=Parvularcula mediterranea TaxID=2732508 RepID=A0A7Y3RMV7_9PROT|nr:hypothetical protein [Parvularcula mediterranea]NNU16998.1 hypothetical protein [Parvularcula mediterranea]